MQFYEALGLEPKLALDPDDLRKRFYERSRESHPDLFGAGAEDRMARLNDAFRTLRDPVARAEYFPEAKGHRAFEERATGAVWKRFSN